MISIELILRYNLRGHTAPPDVLQSTDDGNLFLSYDSTGHDRSIRIWTLETGEMKNISMNILMID